MAVSPALWLGALLALTACTDVQQNFPEGGCEPGAFRCTGQALERCTDDGASYTFYKQCNEDSPCTTTAPYCEGSGPACTSDDDCASLIGDVGDCRVVACNDGQCSVASKATGTPCDDANLCTEGDTCDAGICVGATISCDDGDDCTTDTCDPASGCTTAVAAGADCDDGKPCTIEDTCSDEGVCGGTAKVCEDDNPCTNVACEQTTGECVSMAKAGSCDDGDACTDSDQCLLGQCSGTPAFECTVDSDCASCGNNNPCGGSAICLDGFCKTDPSTAFQCPQEGLGPCQTNTCVAEEGQPTCQVIATEDGNVCDDGSVCTTGDVCTSGACIGTIDSTVPGCGAYRIGWYSFSGGTSTMTNAEYRLDATVGAPAIFGTAIGDTYRVRAVGPGGTEQ